MSYRPVPFKKEHLEVMDLRQHEADLLRDTDYAASLESGVNCTGLVDGRIICCGGVMVLHGGTANIWLLPSVHIDKATKTFVKGLREWLFTVREELGLYRMQSACVDDELHNRWMRSLGFKIEGVLNKFFDGNDYVMYARTQWD